MRSKAVAGDRVRVLPRGAKDQAAQGVVRFACVAAPGVFVELDAPAKGALLERLRFNGGDRLILALHHEYEVLR
jgi:hypothetical protein